MLRDVRVDEVERCEFSEEAMRQIDMFDDPSFGARWLDQQVLCVFGHNESAYFMTKFLSSPILRCFFRIHV